MPRKDFLRDLEHAAAPGRFSCISDIRAGDYDGSISFKFTDSQLNLVIEFQAIVSDSHDYPKDHSYFVFATSENCPSKITSKLERPGSLFAGSTIHELLSSLADIITNAIVNPTSKSSSSGNDNTSDIDDDESTNDTGQQEWDSDEEEGMFGPVQSDSELQRKLRRDLRLIKHAGFRVGYLGSKNKSIIVSVSCRIAKLGISDEAMDAWNVKPSEYVVLLIRYVPTYVDLQGMIGLCGNITKDLVQMHVGTCDSYKPSLQQAVEAFQGIRDHQRKDEHATPDKAMDDSSLRPLFIGKSLNSLLEERLLAIIQLRLQHGYSWTGAELFFNDNQGKIHSRSDTTPEEYDQPDDWAILAPKFLVADHMAEADRNISEISLPLLAMQFTLRHLVKCTEFCLVCHRKTNETFEALKPYVCPSGLCLYQYMTLAMGSSLEYEIHSQPLVVELLISLTYTAARSEHLEEFPNGLRLQVPAKLLQPDSEDQFHFGELNAAKLSLLTSAQPLLKVGDWIVICVGSGISQGKKDITEEWHSRIGKIEKSPGHILLSGLICQGQQLQHKSLPNEYKKVQFTIYDTELDELTTPLKMRMISVILGTLPNVQEMYSFIKGSGKEKLLSTWKHVISPTALDLLRWVVASNRSLIKQDDQNTSHQVTGMNGYVQFRLVQGAPDKEKRFLNAVNSVSLGKNPQYPTIFAWHGSPVQNWHNILREGLHFKKKVHGRSYGDGVYMSKHLEVSKTYACYWTHYDSSVWPQSRLKISTMVSLNEVVNSIEDFSEHWPHYVVRQLDWIQTRYLFVQFSIPEIAARYPSKSSTFNKQDDGIFYEQHPFHLARGLKEVPIGIPISILKGQRGKIHRTNVHSKSWAEGFDLSPKRRKLIVEGEGNETEENISVGENENDDNVSVGTEMEDISILLSDDEAPKSQKETVEDSDPKTDFLPGTLQEDSLPMLGHPRYATTPATKVLQQHLAVTLKTQNQVPLHDLGWYVDHKLINTVYQWIVELHSFDSEIPLAKDLQTVNMQSIVLELRFPSQFPMDPPFIRVIRPRFLGFAQGGGGHVTSGGAMCLELLTQSGWLPTASIESVLLQVRMAILNPDPRPARLSLNASKMDYSVGEAVDAYKRVSSSHGWQISKDIEELAWSTY
ncbi:unnamed protein product [Penicillium salamii]|uniref:UBC core domain-containing protein n=1 Tax=Penicillium salamii TaxID=1612424 RepID=A0A9W4IR04_9EURO|nr:unnamed protein product [Penicillium salamii]